MSQLDVVERTLVSHAPVQRRGVRQETLAAWGFLTPNLIGFLGWWAREISSFPD